MITVQDLRIQFGKSTFLKAISGEIESTAGHISLGSGERLSVLSQDHFAFDEFNVLQAVIIGHKELWECRWY